ncbi:MAG TPA: hypothetical protein VL832_01990 [Puia sp.]|jgi:hypothetical protein|nr:hypothetical protein [Puia sp.]
MNNSLIANAALSALSAFLTNSGEEIAKCIGKDIYDKLKNAFKKDTEKDALKRLEREPFSNDNHHSLEKILILNLADPGFFKEITGVLHITPANIVIRGLILSSINDIKLELTQLYPRWINAGPDTKGEYQNRIEELETTLEHLEKKFYATINPIKRNNHY